MQFKNKILQKFQEQAFKYWKNQHFIMKRLLRIQIKPFSLPNNFFTKIIKFPNFSVTFLTGIQNFHDHFPKFPDFSLTLKKIIFPLLFPDQCTPCYVMHQTSISTAALMLKGLGKFSRLPSGTAKVLGWLWPKQCLHNLGHRDLHGEKFGSLATNEVISENQALQQFCLLYVTQV